MCVPGSYVASPSVASQDQRVPGVGATIVTGALQWPPWSWEARTRVDIGGIGVLYPAQVPGSVWRLNRYHVPSATTMCVPAAPWAASPSEAELHMCTSCSRACPVQRSSRVAWEDWCGRVSVTVAASAATSTARRATAVRRRRAERRRRRGASITARPC